MADAARPEAGPLEPTTVELRLRRLTTSLTGAAREAGAEGCAAPVDRRRSVLIKLAALIALGASATAYASVLGDGGAAADVESVLGTMVAVAPIVGLARLVSATPSLALALGYDVDAALELHDPAPGATCRGRELLVRAIGQDRRR